MTAFWIAAGLLLALVLGLLLPALLRPARPVPNPDQAPLAREGANLALLREQLAQLDAERAAGALDEVAHQAARAEIERRVLDEEDGEAGDSTPPAVAKASGTTAGPSPAGRAPRTAALLALFVPALAIGLYATLGNREALAPQVAAPAPANVSERDVATMVEQLAQRLEGMAGQPNELEGWVLLARSYASMQRFEEADRAYLRAIALAPQEPQLRADRADVLAMKQGRSLAGEPTRLIEEALQLDPNNLKALVLAGSAAFDRRDYASAATYWTRARVNVPAGSELAANIDASLAEARGLAGQGAAGGPPPSMSAAAVSGGATAVAPSAGEQAKAAPVAGAAAAAGVTSVSGSVSLAPGLASRIGPDETVFIFARAAEGPRMPLAIRRHRVAELPLRFTLQDADAMAPELKLSKFPRVLVGARISKSGNAMPQPGDLIATPVAVSAGPGGPELKLVIDQIQP